jgi:hypothetical protein
LISPIYIKEFTIKVKRAIPQIALYRGIVKHQYRKAKYETPRTGRIIFSFFCIRKLTIFDKEFK